MIVEELEVSSMKGTKLHEVERSLFSSLLQLGLQLLGYYILLVKKLVQQEGVPVDSQDTKMKNKGQQVRSYFSVFGRLVIERPKYYSATEKTHYALDAALSLPPGIYSYLLEDWWLSGQWK